MTSIESAAECRAFILGCASLSQRFTCSPVEISSHHELLVLRGPSLTCGHGHAGYYEDGEFGIRIENLLIIKEAETPFRFGDAPYLSFERLTMCPLQRKMIDLEVHA